MKRFKQTNRQWLCASMLLCSCFVALLFTSTTARAATLPKTAKLVPNETIVLVEIDDFTELQTQFEKTNLYKLIKDPVMSPFIDDLKAKWREKKKDKEDDDIPGILRDVDVLPRGRMALAVVMDEKMEDTNDPPVLFITQWGEGIDNVERYDGVTLCSR